MNEQIKQWLESGAEGVFYTNRQRTKYIALPKCENIKIIYALDDYKDYLGFGNDFKYAGIYNEIDRKIYDGNYYSDFFTYEERSLTSIETISEKANKEASEMILKEIEKLKNDLRLKDIKDSQCKEHVNDFLENVANRLARESYINGEKIEDVKMGFHSGIYGLSEVDFISYITNSTKFIKGYSEHYMKNNQDNLTAYVIKDEAIKKEYKKILEDKSNNAHFVKKIIEAVKDSGAKTVNVTILKNNIEFTFKTDSGTLERDHGENGTYSSYDICAQDRKKYKEMFGWEDYKPEEIAKIVYKKKVIYEKEV